MKQLKKIAKCCLSPLYKKGANIFKLTSLEVLRVFNILSNRKMMFKATNLSFFEVIKKEQQCFNVVFQLAF